MLPNIKISLGHIGYIGLLFLPAFLVIENSFLQKWWIFFSSLSLLDLINLIYITNGKLEKLPYSFFSSTFMVLVGTLFFITIFFSISKSMTTVNFKIKFKELMLVVYSSFFFVFVYHLSNMWLSLEINNRERSLFINNLEIHHINYGISLLIIVPFLFKYVSRLSIADRKLNKLKWSSQYRKFSITEYQHYYQYQKLIYILKKLKFFGFVFIGFIYGTVFDECFYYMNEFRGEIQYDKLYLNDTVIIWVSLAIIGISFFIWFYSLKKQKV
jgi:hypothetical protein